ncbi:hypothetical protein [Natranaeroarchaeum sulfidigenes]|uniref:Uncharacterized protein n=1 Tax=Natranaeroarchaeum sulfidigenes TaxID=2784880 RepID=A0A897MPL7_9EURY|nr:hypothetical protein [Natranaeroarchaeum sulfidigenes]QSG02534.1 Uncharacterized protein AArcS_1317 [Natranaeroarchaeum sulfidigenes]
MSTEVDGDRDLEAEAAEAEAGEVGIPFDAICTGCGQTRVKRADEDPENPSSFKHVCHQCGGVTWWNPLSTLTGLMRSNGHPALDDEDTDASRARWSG